MNPRLSRLIARSGSAANATRCISDLRPFAFGDQVLLKLQARDAPPILRKLRNTGVIETHRGNIAHEDIVGKRVRGTVRSVTNHRNRAKEGSDYRIFQPSLEEYVRLTKRLVTPLYGVDCNLLVGVLDLHPSPPSLEVPFDEAEPRLEILEAGTGHGALTLYLSRAIHAANPARPSPEDEEAHSKWLRERRAVIHTIDASAAYSDHAAKTVAGFRHGMYAGNVDFHIGDVSAWLQAKVAMRGADAAKGFLSHVILDLPDAHEHLSTITQALRTDATLVVFAPSITQITDSASHVKNLSLPLELTSVLELGVNGTSGGREWDVRFSRVRPASDVSAESASTVAGEGEQEAQVQLADQPAVEEDPAPLDARASKKFHLVCRPKVGERIIGGGFLGVWKKRSAQ